MEQFIEYLKKVLQVNDDEVTEHSLRAINNLLSVASEDKALIHIKPFDIKLILHNLSSSQETIKENALQLLGTLCAGPAYFVFKLVSFGILPLLSLLLQTSENPAILRDTCFILSNIAAETSCSEYLFEGHFVPILSKTIENLKDYRVTQEASYALSNLCIAGTETNILQMEWKSVVGILLNFLSSKDQRLVLNVLYAFFRVLQILAEREGDALQYFEEIGGVAKVSALQHSENEEVMYAATWILDMFCNNYDEYVNT